MKTILKVAALAAAALSLAGCNALTGSPQNQAALLNAASEIAKDPRCGHTDRLAVNLGAVSTGQLFLERNCPSPAAAPAAAPSAPATPGP